MSSTIGRSIVAYKVNKSGGGVIKGDVVVPDTSNDNAFTTTTSAGATAGVWVADETIANNATGRVVLEGHVTLVNVSASVTRGHTGTTHTVAKQAVSTGATTRTAGTFCKFTTGGTTPEADIWPVDLLGSSLTDPTTTRGDIITRGAAAIQRLALGTAAYGLISDGTDAVWGEVLPWRIQIVPQISTPDASTGTWALNSVTDQQQFPFYVPGSAANSGSAVEFANAATNAQNDAISYNVVLAKGTWDCNIWVRKTNVSCIITLNQDGASQGTADTYNATALAAKVSITGWTVATTGKHVMQFIAATKNASSSDYYMLLHGIEFRRTA